MNKLNENSNLEQELSALREQVLALAGIVESVFAESIIALIDTDFDAAHDAQIDDYKAHQAWLKTDSMAIDLLAAGNLDLKDAHMICAMSHIAQNLKRMADKGMKIANLINECSLSYLPPGACREILPSLTNISQTMFSNSIEAFLNHDPSEANGLHPLYNEVHRLVTELHKGINEELKTQSSLTLETGTALIVIAQCIDDIAESALENGKRIARLYPENSHKNTSELAGERE